MNKRIKRTAVSRWMAMTAAALTLGACSQSEEAVEMLPEGKYPIELTATGLEPAVTPMTRATVEGDWSNVTTVAVQVDGVVKEYSVDVTGSADKKAAVLKSATDPFYWKSTADIKVSAWWPYSATKPATVALVTEQDTKEEYEGSDALEAVEQTVQYTAPTLKFTHRTAKVCVNVVSASGAAMAVDGVTVSLGSNVITPYNPADGNYRCLIPGGTATDANKLSVKITIDGANYVYTHPSAYTFDANKQYTFTLTVKRDGIQLNGCTISDWGEPVEVTGEAKQPSHEIVDGVWHIYNYEGLKAWADAVKASADGNVSAILENDIEMPAPAAGESNWEPAGSDNTSNGRYFRGTFDGNGKTIKGLVIIDDNSEHNNSYDLHQGFFAELEYAEVKNLTLKDVKIETVVNYVGGIAGFSSGSTISGCSVTGGITSTHSKIGGIAGGDSGSTIYACSASCVLKGDNHVGGLCGNIHDGQLIACWANCTFDVAQVYGGIAGDRDNHTVKACYWDGTGAEKGIGYGGASQEGTTDASRKGWDDAASFMNLALIEAFSDYEYHWKHSSSRYSPPVLVKKQQ